MPSKQTTAVADGSDLDQPVHVIGFLLKGLQHSLRHAMEDALREQAIDLSFAHFVTLFSVSNESGINGAALARRVMVSAQTMNAILRRLEHDGRIERRPHPDSLRADSWYVTNQGKNELRSACVVGDSVFARMLSALSPNETAQLLRSLRRCIGALGGSADPVPDGPSPAGPSAERPSPIRRIPRKSGTERDIRR